VNSGRNLKRRYDLKMSETIGIQISKDLRDEMAKFEVNWSEFLSEFIDEKLKDTYTNADATAGSNTYAI